MKRLSTVVLAACIALMAFAVPSTLSFKPATDAMKVAPQAQELMQLRMPSVRKVDKVMKAPMAVEAETIVVKGELAIDEGTLQGGDPTVKYWIYSVISDDENYQFQFCLPTATNESPYGTFTEENGADINSTFGIDWAASMAAGQYVYLDYVSFTMEVTGSEKEGSTLKSTFVASDGNTYDITAIEEGIPEVKETINATSKNMSRSVEMEYTGAYMYTIIMAEDDKYEYQVVLASTASQTYTMPNQAGLLVTDKATGLAIKEEVKVGELIYNKEANPVTLKGNALLADGTQFVIDFSGSYLTGDIDAGEPVERKFNPETAELTIEPDLQYGYVNVTVHADLGEVEGQSVGEELGLSINVAEEVIPAGEYPFGYGYQPNTADANDGLILVTYAGQAIGQSVSRSFFATTVYDAEAQDDLLNEVWLITSGKVVVEYNDKEEMKLTVDATNSYDIPIKVVYDGWTGTGTGMENAQDDATQTIKTMGADGQLYIIRNGHTYTATGALVK